jgi:transcriptional regulator with GAF, ATPase, and Fis domain
LVAPGRETQLVNALAELGDLLVSDIDLAETLHNLVGHCVDLLNVEAAGLMLLDRDGVLRVVAASTERTRLLELLQLGTHTGPGVDCIFADKEVTAPDLVAMANRWPLFVEQARRDGYTAAYAFPMHLRGDVIGAMNLFTTATVELPGHDRRLAQALTDLASVAMLQDATLRASETILAPLQDAVNNRAVIERAKGLVAEAGGLDMDEAFARLRTFARSRQSRLAEIAQELVDGTLKAPALIESSQVIPGAPNRTAPGPARKSAARKQPVRQADSEETAVS